MLEIHSDLTAYLDIQFPIPWTKILKYVPEVRGEPEVKERGRLRTAES